MVRRGCGHGGGAATAVLDAKHGEGWGSRFGAGTNGRRRGGHGALGLANERLPRLVGSGGGGGPWRGGVGVWQVGRGDKDGGRGREGPRRGDIGVRVASVARA